MCRSVRDGRGRHGDAEQHRYDIHGNTDDDSGTDRSRSDTDTDIDIDADINANTDTDIDADSDGYRDSINDWNDIRPERSGIRFDKAENVHQSSGLVQYQTARRMGDHHEAGDDPVYIHQRLHEHTDHRCSWTSEHSITRTIHQ